MTFTVYVLTLAANVSNLSSFQYYIKYSRSLAIKTFDIKIKEYHNQLFCNPQVSSSLFCLIGSLILSLYL